MLFSQEELDIGSHRCIPCGLVDPVQPQGTGESGIMIVWGTSQANRQTEAHLKATLATNGINYDQCVVTSAVRCHCEKITDKQIDFCYPNLLRDIKKYKPKVIIPLVGDHDMAAMKSVIRAHWKKGVGAYQRWVGWQIPLDFWVCPIYSDLTAGKERPQAQYEFYQERYISDAVEKLTEVIPQKRDWESEIEVVDEATAVRYI